MYNILNDQKLRAIHDNFLNLQTQRYIIDPFVNLKLYHWKEIQFRNIFVFRVIILATYDLLINALLSLCSLIR